MAILAVPDNARLELAQGDLLEGVVLHATTPNGKPQPVPADFVLVVSRDCNALRKKDVAVVPVVKLRLELISDSFKQLARRLSDVRDGPAAPDRFYIGTVRDADTRYSACLDTPFTITIPASDTDRAQWIEEHRIRRLTEPFRNSLPRRMFGAYGRVGFDDNDWFCTADLSALVDKGESDRHALESKIGEIKEQIGDEKAGYAKKRKLDSLQSKLEKAKGSLADHMKRLEPYAEALRRRH